MSSSYKFLLTFEVHLILFRYHLKIGRILIRAVRRMKRSSTSHLLPLLTWALTYTVSIPICSDACYRESAETRRLLWNGVVKSLERYLRVWKDPKGMGYCIHGIIRWRSTTYMEFPWEVLVGCLVVLQNNRGSGICKVLTSVDGHAINIWRSHILWSPHRIGNIILQDYGQNFTKNLTPKDFVKILEGTIGILTSWYSPKKFPWYHLRAPRQVSAAVNFDRLLPDRVIGFNVPVLLILTIYQHQKWPKSSLPIVDPAPSFQYLIDCDL